MIIELIFLLGIYFILYKNKTNNYSIKNKVIIVTGASSGIGKECVKKFYNKGAIVILASRNLDKLIETKNELKINKGMVIKCDVSKREDCKKLIDTVVTKYGRIDILVNNAGTNMYSKFDNSNINIIDNIMKVNFYGTLYCSNYAIKHIKKSKGIIIGISSLAGITGVPFRTAYCSSKYAMNGFLDSLRIENLKENITIITACLGGTRTNMINNPVNKDGDDIKIKLSNFMEKNLKDPKEIADKILYGIQKKKNYIFDSYYGFILLYLKNIFPNFINKLIYKIYVNN